MHYRGRNTENLIKFTCFHLKFSRVHVFFQILVKFTCFAMTIVRNQNQSLRILWVPRCNLPITCTQFRLGTFVITGSSGRGLVDAASSFVGQIQIRSFTKTHPRQLCPPCHGTTFLLAPMSQGIKNGGLDGKRILCGDWGAGQRANFLQPCIGELNIQQKLCRTTWNIGFVQGILLNYAELTLL